MGFNLKSLGADTLVKSFSLLFVATMISNVSNYAFQVIMGRLLTPKEYGLMNGLLALIVIIVVPVTPMFTVITRKAAEYKALGNFRSISDLHGKMNRLILKAGFGCFLLFSVLSPYIRDYLHMSTLVPIVIIGFSLFAALAYPMNLAVLQGAQDYKWLGINSALSGPVRFVFAVVFVWAGFGVDGVMAAVVVSGLVMWATSYYPITKFLLPSQDTCDQNARHISFTDSIPVFFTIFAFTLLTQADMVLVNRYFPDQTIAGVYASAAILGKAVMYIPGAIVLALFPMVSEQYALNKGSRHLLIRALSLTAVLSGSGTLLFFFFPEVIINIVYGVQYAKAAPILKYYGLAMLPMALLMVLMNYLIARKQNLFSYIMILGAVLEILAIFLFHESPMQIVFIILFTGAILLAAGSVVQYFPEMKPKKEL